MEKFSTQMQHIVMTITQSILMAVALLELLKLVGNAPKDLLQKQVSVKIYERMALSWTDIMIHTETMGI
jgi:hypothetical protein